MPSPRTLSLHSLPSEHFFLAHLLTHSALPACVQAAVGRASRLLSGTQGVLVHVRDRWSNGAQVAARPEHVP